MKLVRLRLKNFRGYQDSGWIVFENLTAFAGKNDVGKSTILEALDIFFNAGKSGKRKVKISGEDRCVLSKEGDVEIRCCFLCDGERVVIDDKGETTLKDECVVNSDGLLEIAKRYSGEGMKESVFLAADYPTCAEYQDVFMMSDTQLNKHAKSMGISRRKQTNAGLRRLIRNKLGEKIKSRKLTEIGVSGPRLDGIVSRLPLYELFKADRENQDGDNEVKDPFVSAVNRCLESNEVAPLLGRVARLVEKELGDVITRTNKKLCEMNSALSGVLDVPTTIANKVSWINAYRDFEVVSNNGVALNKRGSGLRRLVLLNFFRAEAERRLKNTERSRGLIYAIEEPETAQHYDNQISIIKALSVIAEKGCQVVLTTHSTTVMRQLPESAIRLVKRDAEKTEVIKIDEMKGEFRCLVEPRAKVEVGYLYLGEAVQEYHNLLYGFVTSMGQESNLNSYVKRNHKEDNQEYSRSTKNTETSPYGLCMSVRDHIHHPENKALSHLTEEHVVKSIDYMREYWINIGEKQFTHQPKGKTK